MPDCKHVRVLADHNGQWQCATCAMPFFPLEVVDALEARLDVAAESAADLVWRITQRVARGQSEADADRPSRCDTLGHGYQDGVCQFCGHSPFIGGPGISRQADPCHYCGARDGQDHEDVPHGP